MWTPALQKTQKKNSLNDRLKLHTFTDVVEEGYKILTI